MDELRMANESSVVDHPRPTARSGRHRQLGPFAGAAAVVAIISVLLALVRWVGKEPNPFPHTVATGLGMHRDGYLFLDINLGKTAPGTFGGVVSDEQHHRIVVFISNDVPLDRAGSVLQPFVSEAEAHLVANSSAEAMAVMAPPAPVYVVQDPQTYATFNELYRRLTSETWTVDVHQRLRSLSTDYQRRRVLVGIAGRTDADSAAARSAFGEVVVLHTDNDISVKK